MIFVFGSNLAGRHSKGAALTAKLDFGAEYGVGQGRTGDSYAIPTKSRNLEVLTIDIIEYHVDRFIKYALEHPELQFLVTRVGCGLAGYKDEEIGPLFREASSNCKLPKEWEIYINENSIYGRPSHQAWPKERTC